MAKMVTFEIKGLQELQKALEEVPRETSRQVLRKALTDAAKWVRVAIVSLAPHDTGFLEEHFNIRFKARRHEVAASAFIGPDGKLEYPNKLPKGMSGPEKRGARRRRIKVVSVARFLEFGTGKMAPKPFMTQGFEQSRSNALQILIDGIKDALKNAVATKGAKK
jgi:HK97 gp10 family phage protein